MSYVLAVKCTEPLVISGPDGPVRATAEQLAAAVPAEQWVTASAGMVRAEQSLASLKTCSSRLRALPRSPSRTAQ